MKKISLIMCLLFAACILLQRCDYPSPSSPVSSSSSSKTQVLGSPYVGSFAPVFSAKGVNSESVDLSKLRGQVVLLAFFGTTA